MTRDELIEHCKRQIAQRERWAAIKGEETPSDKVYDEHRFILTLLTQPREHEISLADAIRLAEQGDSQVPEQVEKLVKPEPFINKPCVSEQACHGDTIKVLEKIRAEIDSYSTKYVKTFNWERARALEEALAIIDKYMAESEENKE